MNLVESILQQLAGDTLGKLSSSLGASEEDTKKAVSAAVPTLLSGIGSLAAKPAGADKLWNSLKQVDDDVVTDFGGRLGGARQDELTKSGTSILEALFGKGMMAALIGVLASFLGANKSGLVTKLLPMLAPIILGMIRRQVSSGGLDIAGLTKMLLGEKSNIASAMPAGLANRLASAQGLGDFGGFVNQAKDAAGAASRAASTQAKKAASPAGWLLPLILLGAVLAGSYWFLNRNKPAEVAVPGIDRALESVPNLADVSTEFDDVFANLTTSLDQITDVQAAQDVLPTLQGASRDLDNLSSMVKKLPAASRTQLNQAVETSKNAFQEKADKVLAIPGVGNILQPIISEIIAKLVSLITG